MRVFCVLLLLSLVCLCTADKQLLGIVSCTNRIQRADLGHVSDIFQVTLISGFSDVDTNGNSKITCMGAKLKIKEFIATRKSLASGERTLAFVYFDAPISTRNDVHYLDLQDLKMKLSETANDISQADPEGRTVIIYNGNCNQVDIVAPANCLMACTSYDGQGRDFFADVLIHSLTEWKNITVSELVKGISRSVARLSNDFQQVHYSGSLNNDTVYRSLGPEQSIFKLKPENALLLVEQQLAQNPTDVELLLLRCSLNFALGEFHKSIEEATLLINNEGQVESKYRLLALMYRAASYMEINRIDEALIDLNDIISNSGSDPDSNDLKSIVYFHRAKIAFQKSDYQKALEDIKLADMDKKDVKKLYNEILWARVNKHINDSSETSRATVLEDLATLITFKSESVKALHVRGDFYQKLGDVNSACSDYWAAFDSKEENSKTFKCLLETGQYSRLLYAAADAVVLLCVFGLCCCRFCCCSGNRQSDK